MSTYNDDLDDDRCAALRRGAMQEAVLHDAERVQRLVIAKHRRDDDASAVVMTEIGDCPECLCGVINVLLGRHVGMAESDYDRDELIAVAEQQLLELLDNNKSMST